MGSFEISLETLTEIVFSLLSEILGWSGQFWRFMLGKQLFPFVLITTAALTGVFFES